MSLSRLERYRARKAYYAAVAAEHREYDLEIEYAEQCVDERNQRDRKQVWRERGLLDPED